MLDSLGPHKIVKSMNHDNSSGTSAQCQQAAASRARIMWSYDQAIIRGRQDTRAVNQTSRSLTVPGEGPHGLISQDA